MKPSTRGFLLLAAIASTTVAGCGDRRPTEPEPVTSLSFTYSGGSSGTYSVQGDVRLDGEQRPAYGTWAAALQVPGSDLSITAARAGAAPMADVFLIALHNISAPGTYPLDPGCTFDTPTSCAIGMLAFNYDWNSSARLPDPLYVLVLGTITVSAMDAARIRGTFQVVGIRPPALAPAISLTNGRFDVPIMQALPVQRSMVPLWGALDEIRSRTP